MSADSGLILPGRPQSADEIRRGLEQTRQQIQTSVAALREEVAVATEWRGWYRRDPLLWVGAAFAVGLYLGIRSSNR
ncbi:MAG: hypothetical protein M3Y59_13640 [Myxococcota bacterium]|nr:hypothetical protein [Myxococcota bacterium]